MKDGKPAPRKTRNFIGFANPEDSEHHFFIFPDYETGRAELKASLRRQHIKKTIEEMVRAYAPSKDGNKTEKYVSNLCNETGFNRHFRLEDMSEKQFDCLMDGLEKLEGYHNHKDTRKEVWVPITQVQAGNGTQPVQGEQLVVRSDGKETTYKSNAAGLFPPIVHGEKPAEVFHKTADGNLKKVAELHPTKGQRFSLISKVAEFFGATAPVKAPENPVAKSEGFLYEVKPKDTLGHIAAQFTDRKVTVQRIKQDNQLKTDAIYPGQVLGINMAPPSAMPAQSPKRATPKASAEKTADHAAKSTTAPPTAPNANAKCTQQANTKPPLPPAPATASAPASKTAARSESPPKAQARESQAAKTTANVVPSIPVPLTTNTTSARSKEGKGEALALMAPESGQVPWMKHALAEAKRHNGANEAVIEKSINYQTAIKDGKTTMIGDGNPWCAAFANWCLMRAGYPIQNPKSAGYTDIFDLSRANGFRYVNVKDKIQPEPEIDKVTGKKKVKIKTHLEVNPLYFKIDEPVYGAIAVIVNPHGHGHHVGFAYGRDKHNDKKICVLGGNQGSKISFLPYTEKEQLKTKHTKDGKAIKTKDDHLEFYLPKIYEEEYKRTNEKLKVVDWMILNSEIGVTVDKKEDLSIL